MVRWNASLAAVMICASLAGCGAERATGVAKADAPSQALEQIGPAAPGASRYRVAKAFAAEHWAQIERLESTRSGFPEEAARPNGRQTEPEIVKAFGSDSPDTRHVLLHYAKGWEKGAGTPVLLVHGAVVDATSAWISPHGKEGLATSLTAAGFRVFAVSFAHRHGDNFAQAEQVANAIHRIREVTGASEVDVVAHSKGNTSVRALASGFKQPWMGSYRKDIRRYLSIGGAHGGIDFTYRHSLVNYGLYPEKDDPRMNAPVSWTRMLRYGRWVDMSALKPDGGFFPGQAQLLARWDHVHPLPKLEPDWYTTYHGGQGFVSRSEGIDKAIAAGGHFMAKLAKHPLDKDVALFVLAGNRANMPGILNEKTGPSDGVVFVDSATLTKDMTRGGAKLVQQTVLPVHHMALIYAPEAKAWVAEALKRPL